MAETINKQSTITTYQFPDEEVKYYVAIGIGDYHRVGFGGNNGGKQVRADITDVVRLPLPERMTDNHGVRYEELGLGSLVGSAGQFGADLLNDSKISSIAKDAGAMIGATVPALLGAAGDIAGVAGNGAKNLVNNLAKKGGIATVGVMGYSLNQYMTILLRGPQFKRHQMTWVLSPNTPQEANTIKTILNLFNKSMSPSLEFGGLLFGFPRIFQLAYVPNSKYLYSFKPAVLEAMNVDFTGPHPPAFLRADAATDGDNPPQSVIITCQFLELELWTKENYA